MLRQESSWGQHLVSHLSSLSSFNVNKCLGFPLAGDDFYFVFLSQPCRANTSGREACAAAAAAFDVFS